MPKSIFDWHKVARGLGHETAREWLDREYAKGNSVADVAEITGLSKSGAHKLLQRFGVEMRPRGGPNRR